MADSNVRAKRVGKDRAIYALQPVYTTKSVPLADFFYVGKTIHPISRLSTHVRTITGSSCDTQRAKKIRNIGAAGGKVGLRIIEWVDEFEEDYAEDWWTGELIRRGYNLMNSDKDINDGLRELVANRYFSGTPFISRDDHKLFLSGKFVFDEKEIPMISTRVLARAERARREEIEWRRQYGEWG